MKRTAVLFDMDGLMVDTEPLARAAWQRVVSPFGLTITDDVYQRMLGRRTVESAQLVLDALPLPLSPAELVERKTAEYLASLDGGVPAMPGLWELLARIDELGLPWAVATSTPRPVAEIVLGKLGVQDRYAALAAGDEVAHGKPAPDISCGPPRGWAWSRRPAWRWRIRPPAAPPPRRPGCASWPCPAT